MCLIVVAHRASERFPLVIAANREEDHQRPSLPAHVWEGGEVAGGKDALHGGTWLAISRRGRYAAVTNLRGAMAVPQLRSRGELVSSFVANETRPEQYASDAAARIDQYAAFHLLVGQIGGRLFQVSGGVIALQPGIHGLSNAPAEVLWPKVTMGVEAVHGALEMNDEMEITEQLLRLLHTSSGRDPTRDLFIRGARYGTRSSTVIIATRTGFLLVEQNYGPDGAPGGRVDLRVDRLH